MMPVFSIVIPTRNGERYIGAALESVLGQSYPDFRVFVLESGSTDNTSDIVRSFQDPRILLLSSAENLGIEENWKRILTLDLDPYLTILGHDDLLYPNFLAETLRLIETSPEASLYTTHFNLIDDQDRVVRSCRPIPCRETADHFLLNVHRTKRDSFATGYVMRSKDFRQVDGFPPFAKLMFADHLTWYRLAGLSFKVCSPTHAFAFRFHGESTSHLAGPMILYCAATDYLKALQENGHLESPENRSAAKTYVERYFNGQYHRLLARLIEHSDPGARQRYLEVKTHILSEHAREPLFTVYDMPSRFYEFVAFRTHSYPRQWLSRLIRAVRRVREERQHRAYRRGA